MSSDLIVVDHPAEHVGRVTLNRPERLNAMSIDLVIEKIERQVRKHKEIVRDHLHAARHEKTPVNEE